MVVTATSVALGLALTESKELKSLQRDMCNMQVMQTPPKLGDMFQSLITEHDTLGQRQGPDSRRTRY